ncbi:phage protease [Edwardsiella hoshinae]|uniref:Mu-like prophage I protein n=2 Tax=Edwardsiella hoshinae TaxID=93378 RepID=A0A376DHA6_9GAMM|nr:phage protease [Edwardsiella hoshinae]QPR26776.1 phage protease [Edwardsiella hoshinae]STC89445.1 Mu-like prophage I protein [Edwardsiella hoshinae]
MKTILAALSVEIAAGTEPVSRLRILPAGEFRGVDGRPRECAAWVMTATTAAHIIETVNARVTELCFDYEHQTLRAAENGKPAPASGWFSRLEWIEGDGLYATDIRWTDTAADMIRKKEYRYISPVFFYDQKTGEVTALVNVALTNTPALDDLDEVAVAALSRLAALSTTSSQSEGNTMDEEQISNLLANLRWMFNLPETATADDIKAEIEKVIAAMSDNQGMAAASLGLMPWVAQKVAAKDQVIATCNAQITALSAAAYDPAKYVPIEAVNQLRAQLSQVQANVETQALDGLVQAALSDGRLVPAMEGWAKDLGRKDPAALKTYLEGVTPLAALSSMQSSQSDLKATHQSQKASDELDATQLAICSSLGITPDEMAKALGEE